MSDLKKNKEKNPDSTAVRVALWRAMHVQLDPPPHVLKDEVGFELVAPSSDWQSRPDMHPQGTSRFRASIVARARFIEDLVLEQIRQNVHQYIILGAGLDTFAQRRPEVGANLKLFEVDQLETQLWKRRRLEELDYDIPNWLEFVPINFESGASIWTELAKFGFNKNQAAIVSSLGVSMYLTKDAIKQTIRDMAELYPGSKFIMTFMLPLDQVDPEDQFGYQMAEKGARASGTPFISFFTPTEMVTLAREVGFRQVEHLSTRSLVPKYFANRTDNLRPSSGEELLVLTT